MGTENRPDETGSQFELLDAGAGAPANMAPIVGERAVATEVTFDDGGGTSASLMELAADAAERFDTRAARPTDIRDMVAIDLAGFRRVYEGQGKTDDELRAELTAMFEERLSILGGELMPVVTERTDDGGERIVGFTHLMRTDRSPDELVSWEDTTANGWLTNRHNPNGRYMYVVTLSMSPSVAREDAPSLLAARARAIMVERGCELIYSLSRLPGMRGWMERRCRIIHEPFDDLSTERIAELAHDYFGLTRVEPDSGMILPRDPMLAFCVLIGNLPQRLVPDGYNDKQSMHFGAVCVMPNPLLPQDRTPERVARVSQLFMAASHSLDQANALASGGLPTN